MRVVIKRPGMLACIWEIENTLKAFQEEVGGYIETVPFDGELLAIVNEEGRIMGLPYNFTLNGERIVGTAVICKTAGDEFAGLTEEEADLVERIFDAGVLREVRE